MLTANYEYSNTSNSSDKNRTRSKYRKALAYVYGTVRGVPFRVAVKTERAVQRALSNGYEVHYA